MSKINLCENCIRVEEFPLCIDKNVEFGNGKGNDNIIKCSWYQPIDKTINNNSGGTNDNSN